MHQWLTNALVSMCDADGHKGIVAPKKGGAQCDLFNDHDCMRFYYACLTALAKPGDPLDNFLTLDSIDLKHRQFFRSELFQEIVDWIDAHRAQCSACDNRAKAMRRSIAENWNYFDNLPADVVANMDMLSKQTIYADKITDCLQAFRKRNYNDCIQLAQDMISTGDRIVIFQIILISLQRTSGTENVDDMDMQQMSKTPFPPWEHSILKLTLGKIELQDVLTLATTDIQRCQAYYYAGARMLTLANFTQAKELLNASLDASAECTEVILAMADILETCG